MSDDVRDAAKLALARAVMGASAPEGLTAEDFQVEVTWEESIWNHGCGGDCHPGYETPATIQVYVTTTNDGRSLEGEDVARALQRMLAEG